MFSDPGQAGPLMSKQIMLNVDLLLLFWLCWSHISCIQYCAIWWSKLIKSCQCSVMLTLFQCIPCFPFSSLMELTQPPSRLQSGGSVFFPFRKVWSLFLLSPLNALPSELPCHAANRPLEFPAALLKCQQSPEIYVLVYPVSSEGHCEGSHISTNGLLPLSLRAMI